MANKPLFTKLFWVDAGERAIATFAQTLIALVVAIAPTMSLDLLKIDYIPLTTVALIASLLSIVKSVGAAVKAGTDTASLVVDNKELKQEVKQ